MNVTFGLIEDTSHSPIRDRTERRRKIVDRALAAIKQWRTEVAAAGSPLPSGEGQGEGETPAPAVLHRPGSVAPLTRALSHWERE
jgi:hypothetical protein